MGWQTSVLSDWHLQRYGQMSQSKESTYGVGTKCHEIGKRDAENIRTWFHKGSQIHYRTEFCNFYGKNVHILNMWGWIVTVLLPREWIEDIKHMMTVNSTHGLFFNLHTKIMFVFAHHIDTNCSRNVQQLIEPLAKQQRTPAYLAG